MGATKRITIENDEIEKILDQTCISSKESIKSVYLTVFSSSHQFIPVVDNGELTGALDIQKVKKLKANQLANISVRTLKEDPRHIALCTTKLDTLKNEMDKKQIEQVFIIDKNFQFKGSFNLAINKNYPEVSKTKVTVFDRLFNMSLQEVKI